MGGEKAENRQVESVQTEAVSISAHPRAPRTRGRFKGFAMVITGGLFWGLSGTAAQQLFHADGFTVGWLTGVRMIVSGLLLLGMAGLKKGQPLAVWKSARSVGHLLIFAFVGLAAVQYTYFASVSSGNAAAATLLQYTGPLFMTLFLALRAQRWPTWTEAGAISIALFGTFLLVTNGSLQTLAVPATCVVWGLLSALALAFYTLFPRSLIAQYGTATVIGWGMLVGGAGLACRTPPWQTAGQHWTLASSALVVFVVVFGTFIAFYLYLSSLRFITPTETSLLGGVEPLSAAVAGAVWLNTPFTLTMAAGGVLILITVAILGAFKPSQMRRATAERQTEGL